MIVAALAPDEVQWVGVALGVMAFLIAAAAGVTVILVNIKKLRGSETVVPAPQPFVVTLADKFVSKETFEARQEDVDNQLKDARAYFHDQMHEVNNKLNGVSLVATQNKEAIHADFTAVRKLIVESFRELDEKRSRSIGNLHEHLSATKERMASAEAGIKAAGRAVESLERKVDDLRKDIPAPAATSRTR